MYSNQPSPELLRGMDFSCRTSSTFFAAGAQRRKRTPPPGCTSAPNGMEWLACMSALQQEKQQRAAGDEVLGAEGVVFARCLRVVGVEQAHPALAVGHLGQLEL